MMRNMRKRSRREFLRAGAAGALALPFLRESARAGSGELPFVVIGDWGWDGDFKQKDVALRMGTAAALARQRAKAHLAREQKLEEIAFLAGEKDAEILEKDAEIVSLKRATDEREAEIDAKEAEIAALARACEERLQLIIRIDADLKRYVQEVGRLQAEVLKMKVDPPRNLN